VWLPGELQDKDVVFPHKPDSHAGAGVAFSEEEDIGGRQSSLDSDARVLAGWLDTHKAIVLLAFTVVYFFGAVLHARSKPFWYDEIITVIVAKTPDLATAWRAATECDAMPPLSHALAHISVQWFGVNEVSVRLPAMLGFWIFCLSLFWYTRKSIGIYYALTAMLLPMVTGAYLYSMEARAYGPELAFCGLALVAWQRASENRKRAIAIPGLAICLAAALLCHYYAALLYVPLCGGELMRSYRARRIDWGIWAALGAGTIPVFWRMATIAGVVRGFTHTWSPASPDQVLEFWETGLQHAGAFVALWLAVLALAIVANRNTLAPVETVPAKIPDHEWIAGALFLTIPIAAVAGGLLVTHMFTFRYALIGLTGFCLLAPMLAAHLLGGRALWGFLMFGVAAVGLGFATIDTILPQQNPFDAEPILQQALRQGPVAIADGQLFLRMWQYAPVELKSRMFFIADNEAAVKYLGFETIDGGMRALVPWSSISLVEYADFAKPGREFLVYQNTLRPGWLLSKVVDDGGLAEIQKNSLFRSLIRVRLKS
jgi:hypothetical protein